jgi:hypothetical protein
MSATASDLMFGALCPWLHITTMVHMGCSRITVVHGDKNEYSQSFEVDDLHANFASAFQHALKIKRELIEVDKFHKALISD